MIDLKPCRICGVIPKISSREGSSVCEIKCATKGCKNPFAVSFMIGAEDEAAELWNEMMDPKLVQVQTF